MASRAFQGMSEVAARIGSVRGMTAEGTELALRYEAHGGAEVGNQASLVLARANAEANLVVIELLAGIHGELVKLNAKKSKKDKTLYNGK